MSRHPSQDVSPWNVKYSRDVTEPALAPRAEIADVTLEEWAAMDEAEWKRRTQGTAIRRAKWEGFRRNVAVAHANASTKSLREQRRAKALLREPGDGTQQGKRTS